MQATPILCPPATCEAANFLNSSASNDAKLLKTSAPGACLRLGEALASRVLLMSAVDKRNF